MDLEEELIALESLQSHKGFHLFMASIGELLKDTTSLLEVDTKLENLYRYQGMVAMLRRVGELLQHEIQRRQYLLQKKEEERANARAR